MNRESSYYCYYNRTVAGPTFSDIRINIIAFVEAVTVVFVSDNQIYERRTCMLSATNPTPSTLYAFFTKPQMRQVCFEGCRLQVAGCRLQVAGCRLQVAGCRLQAADCRLQVAGCRLQVAQVNGCRPS